MRRDTRAYLWDARQAAELLSEFREGKDFAGYQTECHAAIRPSSVSSRSSERL